MAAMGPSRRAAVTQRLGKRAQGGGVRQGTLPGCDARVRCLRRSAVGGSRAGLAKQMATLFRNKESSQRGQPAGHQPDVRYRCRLLSTQTLRLRPLCFAEKVHCFSSLARRPSKVSDCGTGEDRQVRRIALLRRAVSIGERFRCAAVPAEREWPGQPAAVRSLCTLQLHQRLRIPPRKPASSSGEATTGETSQEASGSPMSEWAIQPAVMR